MTDLPFNSHSRAEQRQAPSPFSLRLTFEERTRLEREAGDMPLGAYIRSRLLAEAHTPRRTRQKRPVQDHQSLAQVLGALAQSRLSNNLNQLAKAAHTGALPLTPEVEAELREACAAIGEMRARLLHALGLSQGPGS